MSLQNLSYTTVLEEDGRWSAWLTDYPSCAVWGLTEEEALEALPEMAAVFFDVMDDSNMKFQHKIPEETKQALERIRKLPDNWDEDGASKIDDATVDKAEQLIAAAFCGAPYELKLPSVAAGYGGMIVVEWSGITGGNELIVDVHEGDKPFGYLLVKTVAFSDIKTEYDGKFNSAYEVRELLSLIN